MKGWEEKRVQYDYSLYLVTDRGYVEGGSLAGLMSAVEQAIAGGCTMVQLRESNITSADFYYEAKEIKRITDRYDIPLIINNRADIALAVGAAGVHVGQSDIPASAIRRMTGRKRLVGVSVTSVTEALKAQREGADYLGVGAIYPTKTKKDAKIVPINELRAIKAAAKIPVVAIGGINRENAAEVLRLGVDGLAVISAILSQKDIRHAAEELKNFTYVS